MQEAMQQELDRLHHCHLLLAEELRRICQKHQIKHFVIAGTLLGAVRHKGFIPWDDDMDFGLLRADYEKLLQVLPTELGERFYFKSLQTKGFAYPFAKLYLKNTLFLEATSAKTKFNDGIYIDIFPMDALPDDPKLQKAQNKKLYFLKRLLLAKLNYNPCKKSEYAKRVVYTGLKVLSIFWSEQRLKGQLNRIAKRYSGQKTKLVGATGGAYGYFKEAVCSSWFNSAVELPFEQTTVFAPAGYTAYLERFYGDYMTPPPEDKRYNRHSALKVDFGPYQTEETK